MQRKPTGFIIYKGPSQIDGAPIVAVAITASTNRKTGNMVQTYILRTDLAPMEAVRVGADASICGDCQHRGDGTGKGRTCYVNLGHGPRAVFDGLARGIYPSAQDAPQMAVLGADRMVRLGTYGDPAAVPAYVWRALLNNAKGWTGYTHQWRKPIASELRTLCMASTDSEAERAEAIAQGWRTFRVRTETESLGAGEVACPASEEAGRKLQCAQCGACKGADGRRGTIAIIAHGATRKTFMLKRI